MLKKSPASLPTQKNISRLVANEEKRLRAELKKVADSVVNTYNVISVARTAGNYQVNLRLPGSNNTQDIYFPGWGYEVAVAAFISNLPLVVVTNGPIVNGDVTGSLALAVVAR